MLRWLLRVLVALVILAALAALAVQVVLSTDWPRRRVVQALEERTGLDIQAARLDIAWSGRSSVENLSASLPLEEAPFLTAPALRISHAGLIRLLISRDLDLREVVVDRPTLTLRQDIAGRWNIVEAIDSIRQRGDDDGDGGAPSLPAIVINDGTLQVEADGRVEPLAPLAFEGRPSGRSAWAFRIDLGPGRTVEGRLAPGEQWHHELAFSLDPLRPLLAPFVDAVPDPITGQGRWRGRFVDGGLAGILSMDPVRIGHATLRGRADAVIQGADFTLRPRDVTVESEALPAGTARLTAGALRRQGALLVAEGTIAEWAGALATIDARWDTVRQTGDLEAAWIGQFAPRELRHEGQIHLALRTPQGHPRLTAQVQTLGFVPAGRWDATLDLDVRGPSWTTLEVTASAPTLVWTDEAGPIDAGGLRLRAAVEERLVRLAGLELPNAAATTAEGRFDLDTHEWSIDLRTERWTPPRAGDEPIDFAVRARGDEQHVDFSDLRLVRGGLTLTAGGTLHPRAPQPLRARALLTFSNRPPSEESREQPPEIGPPTGDWAAELDVSGSVRPLDLRLAGGLSGRHIAFASGQVEALTIPVSGRLDEEGLALESESFDLLDGQWRLGAAYAANERATSVRLRTEAVPLQRVLDLFAVPIEMGGELSTDLLARLPGLDVAETQISGSWNASGLAYAGYRAQRGAGRFATRGEVLRFEDIVLSEGDGTLRGWLEFNIRERRHLVFDLVAERWPAEVRGTETGIVLDGRAAVDLDVVGWAAQGTVRASGDVYAGDAPLGSLAVDADLDGRIIRAQRIAADLPSGTVRGHAAVPLDEWTATTAELRLDNANLAELAQWADLDDFLTGVVTGDIRVEPSTSPLAAEPLRIYVALDVEGGRYRALSFGDARLMAYAGPTRLLLDQSRFNLAGGTLELWARLSRHGTEPFLHFVATARGTELNQVVQSLKPGSEPILGRVSGQVAAGGYIHPPHRAFGEGRLTLADSDLANVPIIAFVYDLLNINLGGSQMTGRGTLDFRLDGDALELTRLQYYNRGADIIAEMTIRDMWMLGESPIEGVAAGTIRPLRDTDLPLLSDFDRLFSALQSDAASAEISGTLREPKTRVVPFERISGTVGRVLGLSPRSDGE